MARIKRKDEDNEVDAFEVVKAQLSLYGGRQKPAGEYMMVQCPFHEDGSPSCGVYMRIDHPSKRFGYFNCLGCATSGPWNVFAAQTGLQTINEWDTKEKTIGNITSAEDERALLGESGVTLRSVLKHMDCMEAQPWPDNIPWRGFKGSLVAEVGGMIINDNYNENVAVLFPIRINGKVKGGVKAIYEKRYKAQLGYITMKGEWVNKYGIFLYDYVKNMIAVNEYTFVILVEGPRDALRLVKLGLPAVAILGANTLGKQKAMLLASMGVDYIYAMPDNDKGGSVMWKNVKESLADKATVRRLKLPVERDEEGKIIKVDPFNAPIAIINTVKDLMFARHGWTKPKRKRVFENNAF